MNQQSSQDRVRIFDTTLRDGEQAPGCSMTLREKLKVARALRDMRVDVIEAGFAAASPGDFESVREIARAIRGVTICSLARCHAGDIERSAKALEPAARKRIHVFVATSEIHRKFKLEMARDEIVRRAVEAVRMAREACDDVEFSPEDASRTEPEFLTEIVTAVVEAGATTVNIPDTVGYAVPAQFQALFEHLRATVPGVEDVVLSAHCHDDLGLSVANSLAAVAGGARQIECTINGIGERAGNCSLEEVVMALKVRADHFGVDTGIETKGLYPASRLVSSVTGMHTPRNKAIVGQNAFAHEAGIHQHGMLKHAETYEIMRPEAVGMNRSNLVLGKHSGRHAFRDRTQQLGFELSEDQLNRAFIEFKKLADRKKELFDADIEALIVHKDGGADGPWKLRELRINTGGSTLAVAAVRLEHESGEQRDEAAVGDGPIDATFKALERATGLSVELTHFEVRSVTTGEDAQGEATVTARWEEFSYRGRAVSTDIVEAGAQALLEVLNRALRAQARVKAGQVATQGARRQLGP
ncbi:2-isopropylmalate synthase [Candidatus Foliamicus sp.]